MDHRHMLQGTFGIPTQENASLTALKELIEISIADTHLILHSVQDITKLCRAAAPVPHNRDSGFFEPQGEFNGDDLGRRLREISRGVEETRTCLRELQRANLRGLQLILEDPEGQYAATLSPGLGGTVHSAKREPEIVITLLRHKIKANFDASNDIHRLAQQSPQLIHIGRVGLEC